MSYEGRMEAELRRDYPRRRRPKTYAPGKGITHPGSLTHLGYQEHEKPLARRRALGKAVRRFGYAKTQEKLTALKVLNKRTNPEFERVLQSDQTWLRQKYRPSSLRER